MIKIVCLFIASIVLVSCTSNVEPYAYAEELDGIGCLRLGDSYKDVKAALDSNYLNYRDVIRKNHGSINFVDINRNKMIYYKGPSPIETPDKYNTDYKKYEATLIISEELAVKEVELYFWHDTLHKISFLNRIGTDEVAEALIYKYGEGAGPKKKTGSRTEEVHIWGNDLCVATYVGNITYSLNSQGLASGVQSWFHRIDITLSEERMNNEITRYLEHADSLYQASKYNGI